jgi:hypothetical protein
MSEKTKLVFKKEIGAGAWPCTISVPQDDGARQEQMITPRFRVIPQSEIDELYTPEAFRRGNSDAVLMQKVVAGFDGLKDESGEPVPDDVAKATLLGIPYVVDGLTRGYSEMLGRRTAKN